MNNKWLSVIFITLFLPCIMAQTIPNLQVIASETIEADYFEETIELSSFGAVVSSYFLKDISYLQFGELNIFESITTNSVQNFECYLVPFGEFVDFNSLEDNGIFETSLPIELRGTSLNTFQTLNFSYHIDGEDNQDLKLMNVYYSVKADGLGDLVKVYYDEIGEYLAFQIGEEGIPRGFDGLGLYDEILFPDVANYFELLGLEPTQILSVKFRFTEPTLEEKRIFIAMDGENYLGWLVDLDNNNEMNFARDIPVMKTFSHEGSSLLFAEQNVYDLWISY